MTFHFRFQELVASFDCGAEDFGAEPECRRFPAVGDDVRQLSQVARLRKLGHYAAKIGYRRQGRTALVSPLLTADVVG